MISFTHKSLHEITVHQDLYDGYIYFFPLTKNQIIPSHNPFFITPSDFNLMIDNNDFKGIGKNFFAESIVSLKTIKHIACIGIGDQEIEDFNTIKEHIRHGCGLLTQYIEKKKLKNCVIVIDETVNTIFKNLDEVYELITETLLLASYQFNTFITNKKKHAHNSFEITFLVSEENNKKLCDTGIQKGTITGNATNNARTWGDMPPSHMHPISFAEEAEKLLKKHSTIDISILKKNDLEKLNMGGILGVCQGSRHEPRLFIAHYKSKSSNGKTIALVGKGVTFDTGGISIKPADNMEDMKNDMAGGCVVISALDALASLNCSYDIIVAVPMVENMPGGKSIKPGDILTFYNGKTAEVKNTDAEGRLILADALSYVSDVYKPDHVLDFATLTGACCIALGPCYAAILTQNHELAKKIHKAGNSSGNRCWELPLDDCYAPAVESEVADVCNIGRKGYKAGTITAGYFLRHFVPQSISWAHLDIASVSMHAVGKNYIRNHGATGFGVNLIVEMLTKNYL